MSSFYDVPGFHEANARYENQHPDDYGREDMDPEFEYQDDEPEMGDDDVAGGEDEE